MEKLMSLPKKTDRLIPSSFSRRYDSGLTAAEMDMTARGKIGRMFLAALALQVEPNRSFAFASNELSKGLKSLAGTQTTVTLRGQ